MNYVIGMIEKKLWREFHICRELYGSLVTLATRPISKGNDIALIEGKRFIKTLINDLEKSSRQILLDHHISLIQNMLALADSIPLQNMANSIVGSLHQLLARQVSDCDKFPIFYARKFYIEKDMERLVVSVGPTIGLGDEILLAKALVERACLGNITLYIETQRFDLWDWLNGQTVHIGKPPVSSIDYIDSLNKKDCEKTGYIYADFLTSDPSIVPYYVPKNIVFSGRWIFGNASGIIVNPKKRVVHRFRYPDSMPSTRNLECAWMAARFLPFKNKINPSPEKGAHNRNVNVKNTILIQALTSKPSLILPASFYKRCFEELLRQTQKQIKVKILAGPTVTSQKITSSIYNSLIETLHPSQVTLLEPLNCAGVLHELNKADLLFGPDTFTGHSAAIKGISQVTICLPEHCAWMNPATPSFFIPMQYDLNQLAIIAATRIAFTLQGFEFNGNEIIKENAKTWRVFFLQIETYVKKYVYNMEVDLAAANDNIKRICRIINESRHFVNNTVGSYQPNDYEAFLNFDFSVYEDHDDAMCALAAWYHSLGTSDLSGLFFNIT